jgi:hypothetical protein
VSNANHWAQFEHRRFMRTNVELGEESSLA